MALLGSVLGRLVNFVGQVVVARWLGPAMLGLYALGWGAFRLLSLPATLGINNGLQRFGSISRSRDGLGGAELLGRSLRLTLITSGVVGLGLAAASPWLAESVYSDERLLPILLVFGLALPAAALLRVAAAATRVSQDLRASVLLEDFGQPFLFAGLAALLLALGGGVLGVAAAAGLSFLLVAPMALYWARRWFPRSPEPEPADRPLVSAWGLVRYSLPTALAGTVGVTMTWLDRLLVGYYMPHEAVGWYQVAAQASGAFAVVLGAFSAIFAPMIAGLLERGEDQRLQELFRVTTKWGVLAVVPGGALCLLYPEAALAAIFGADYLPAAEPLLVLVVGQMVTAATGAVGYLLMMSGRPNLWLGLSLGALAADIVLNVVLIPRFGLVGAAAATTLALAVLYLSGLAAVRRQLGLWPYDRRFLGVAAAVLVAFVGTAALRWVPGMGPATTVGAVVLAAAGLTVAAWRLFCFGAEDRQLLATLRRLGR